jgi:hypothetical protein
VASLKIEVLLNWVAPAFQLLEAVKQGTGRANGGRYHYGKTMLWF